MLKILSLCYLCGKLTEKIILMNGYLDISNKILASKQASKQASKLLAIIDIGRAVVPD